MKSLLILFISLFLFTFSFSSYASPPLTGKQIILKQKELNAGYHDELAEGILMIGSQKRECVFKQLEGKTTKSLIKIIKPADLQGMTLLNYQNEGGGGDQWLYLPSSQQTKRIAGQGSQGRFLGSEFTYEDLLPKKVHRYDYTLLRVEPCTSGTCYVIKAKPFFSSVYSKTIIWVDQNNYQNMRIDFYDKKERLMKRSVFSNYKQFKGKFFRPMKITMTNLVNQKQTELIIKKMEIGVGLKEGDFTRQVLGR